MQIRAGSLEVAGRPYGVIKLQPRSPGDPEALHPAAPQACTHQKCTYMPITTTQKLPAAPPLKPPYGEGHAQKEPILRCIPAPQASLLASFTWSRNMLSHLKSAWSNHTSVILAAGMSPAETRRKPQRSTVQIAALQNYELCK